MNQPTRRVRAGAPPPHMPVIDFAEPEPPDDVNVSTREWLGLAIAVCFYGALCFGLGYGFSKWVTA